MCARCGESWEPGAPDRALACGRCERFRRPFAFESAVALWRYAGPVRDVVQAFKYAGRADCLSPLGRRLARTPRLAFSWDGPGTRAERRRALRVRQGQAHARGADGDWLVVPVPARRESYGRRGYDQAVLLAESLAASAGLDCDPAALRRRRQGRAQAGAPLELRLAQMRAAFQARPGRVAGRPVLLVDDVLSTGATADASARALRLAGSPRVRVVSLAT